MHIAVKEEERRKGYAERLLRHIIKEALKSNKSYLFLEVRESNIPAIRLYEKFSFIKYGKRANYYSSNSEDALLYKLEISIPYASI